MLKVLIFYNFHSKIIHVNYEKKGADSMEKRKEFYVTTPIYYPSGKFHIGTAYTTTLADAIKRYKTLRGYETYLLTGNDEHGQKIQTVAEKNGITPKEHVDKMAEEAKVAVRNVRRDAMDKFKAAKKAGELTEDDQKKLEEKMQKITDKFIKEIDEVAAKKTKEVMEL